MNELKSCPFCGAASEDIETVVMGSGLAYIRCSKCLSQCGMRDGVDAAERLWNSRELDNLIKKICEKIKLSPTLEAEVKESVDGFYDACNELDRSTKLLILKIIADSINEDAAAAEQGG